MTVVSLKTITPIRTTKNRDVRSREHLLESEVYEMVKVVRKKSQNSTRDICLILMMYRHGFRVSEIAELKWDQIDFEKQTVLVVRLKGGIDSVHDLSGEEIRYLRKLQRKKDSRYVFLSQRGAPMTSQAIYRMFRNLEKYLKWDFPIHPHMLRHACGYALADKGVDVRRIQMYMGHSNVQNTVIYTQLSGKSLKNIWAK